MGDDVLAAGVAVMARPPGKRNSSIHQLSGGEKALTAVALVFSIFDLNPAPFCLLDEVDAPLDEHNVGRFCDIVQADVRARAVHLHHAQQGHHGARLAADRRHHERAGLLAPGVRGRRRSGAHGHRLKHEPDFMNELRVILLVAGLLFIAGIAGFEWWRARRSRPAAMAPREEAPTADSVSVARPAVHDVHVVREPRMAVGEDLPVIELASTSASGTRRALGISISDEVAVNMPGEEPPPAAAARTEPYIGVGPHDEISEVRVYEEQPVRGPQLVLCLAEGIRASHRHAARGSARRAAFRGTRLRQAFASAGFWHGPLDIYHLPDDAGRVVVSAAALAQPGTFDPSIMDSQRFSGLNLFAVLPGPMPEREAFDELVRAARALAERLEGSLTDQHGEELTPQRIARLRQSLRSARAGARRRRGLIPWRDDARARRANCAKKSTHTTTATTCSTSRRFRTPSTTGS